MALCKKPFSRSRKHSPSSCPGLLPLEEIA
jgi:hypothetical protein